MRKKTIWLLDIIKLVFAIFIVIIHARFLNENIFFDKYFRVTIFDVVVPFFFACSGYFVGEKLRCKESKEKIVDQFYGLLKTFCIFGGWYFTLEVIKAILLTKDGVISELKYLVWRLIVQSPGGGLWYVYALLFLLIIIILQNDISCKKKYVIDFVVFIAVYIWGLLFFKGGIFPKLEVWYSIVLFDNRNFLFFGVYFFGGILIALYYEKFRVYFELHSAMRKLYFYVMPLFYFGIGYPVSIDGNSLFSYLSFNLIKVVFVFGIIIISIEVSEKIEIDSKRIRKMSTIIYFCHFTFVYMLFAVESVFRINYKLGAIICALCVSLFGWIFSSDRVENLYKLFFS